MLASYPVLASFQFEQSFNYINYVQSATKTAYQSITKLFPRPSETFCNLCKTMKQNPNVPFSTTARNFNYLSIHFKLRASIRTHCFATNILFTEKLQQQYLVYYCFIKDLCCQTYQKRLERSNYKSSRCWVEKSNALLREVIGDFLLIRFPRSDRLMGDTFKWQKII